MVESQTSVKPHYVTLSKNGKILCEDCPGWKASKICAHAVAAAEMAGTTDKYIKWLKEKGPTSMNLTALITSDSHSSTGKKGGRASTARRKGGRSSQIAPASIVIDRFEQQHVSTTRVSSPPLGNFEIPTMVTPQSEQAPATSVQLPLNRQAAPAMTTSASFQVPTHPTPQSQQAHATNVANQFVRSLPNSQPLNQRTIAPPILFREATYGNQQSSQSEHTKSLFPKSGTFVVNLLKFCPPLVRSCYGCSQSLKPLLMHHTI